MWPLAKNTWQDEEWNAVLRCRTQGRITIGPEVDAFEREFAEYNAAYMGVACNSGSSANLLAVAAISSLDQRKGTWVVPAIGWNTTYAPLHQYGHQMLVVDVDSSLNLDPSWLRRAVKEHDIMGVMSVNVLGVPAALGEIQQICQQNGLWWIEDNCESLGAMSDGFYAGTAGDMGTFSFFFSHHISTGEGGMLLARNPALYGVARSLRSHGWTRGVASLVGASSDPRYASFDFLYAGYNLRMMDLQAAPGREQLKKMRLWRAVREENLLRLRDTIKGTHLHCPALRGQISPMAAPFYYAGPESMEMFLAKLSIHDIEHRPLIAGNIVQQRVARQYNLKVPYSLGNAQYAHDRGFYLGLWSEKMPQELFDELRKCAQ